MPARESALAFSFPSYSLTAINKARELPPQPDTGIELKVKKI